jgi:hypothetical protein
MNRHLSSAQISEWVAGDHTTECEQHLRECAACSAELAVFESGLAVLGRSVRYWAAQQDFESQRSIPDRGDIGRNRWRLAVVAAAAGALALLPVHWSRNAQREAQWAEDAQLLSRVNAELARTVPATMQPLMDLMQKGLEENQ